MEQENHEHLSMVEWMDLTRKVHLRALETIQAIEELNCRETLNSLVDSTSPMNETTTAIRTVVMEYEERMHELRTACFKFLYPPTGKEV